jgi:hypothetical protein
MQENMNSETRKIQSHSQARLRECDVWAKGRGGGQEEVGQLAGEHQLLKKSFEAFPKEF